MIPSELEFKYLVLEVMHHYLLVAVTGLAAKASDCS